VTTRQAPLLAGVGALALVVGVALGVAALDGTGPAGGVVENGSSPAATASPAAGAAVPAVPTTHRRVSGCPEADALLAAYTVGQAGDERSTVVPGSIHCAGPYVAAEVRDPSLPDQLNVLFSSSPPRRLRSGTGPVCEVGSGEGGLPPITASQGAVLDCA
jgi:hypothetical protein